MRFLTLIQSASSGPTGRARALRETNLLANTIDMAVDPWSELGLARGASGEEVKQAYRKLVLEYHPDRCDVRV